MKKFFYKEPILLAFMTIHDLLCVCLLVCISVGEKCEECSRVTATCSCNKCETLFCSGCFERVM